MLLKIQAMIKRFLTPIVFQKKEKDEIKISATNLPDVDVSVDSVLLTYWIID